MARVYVFVMLVALLAAMGMGVGLAAADEPDENGTDKPEYEIEFGDDLRILEYELEDGEARITFDADRSRTVAVSDALAGVDQEGAVEVPSQEYDLSDGETTISMDVRELRGASTVGVTVDGSTARLSTEMQEPETEEENPFHTFGGESGLFFGTGMATTAAALGAFIVIRQEESGVIEA